jgi:tetratricopeptide (TPR) repeat protein
MKAMTHISKLQELLVTGVNEARSGNKLEALACFKGALELDNKNEAALMWCATLTNDPFEARNYLLVVLQHNPNHRVARTYYELAQKRCDELDSLLSSSNLIRQWRNEPDPNSIIPRLGQFCMQKGWVSDLQVKAALHYQKYLREQGHNEKLGDILVSFGYLDKYQLQEALDFLHTEYNNRFLD